MYEVPANRGFSLYPSARLTCHYPKVGTFMNAMYRAKVCLIAPIAEIRGALNM